MNGKPKPQIKPSPAVARVRKPAPTATRKRPETKSNPARRQAVGKLLQAQPNAEAQAIAAAIAAPGAFPPKRYQDGYDCLDTTINAPITTAEANLSSASAGTDALGLPLSASFAFAFRDPRRALVVYDTNEAGDAYSYQLFDEAGGTITRAAQEDLDLQYGLPSTAGGLDFHPHGEFLYSGSATEESQEGSGYFPATGNDQLLITGLAPSTAYEMVLDYTDLDGEARKALGSFTSSAGGVGTVSLASFGIPTTSIGYVRLSHFNSAVTNISIFLQGSGPVCCHLSLGQFEEVDAFIESFRANGMSLMFTNTAPEIYRNGKLAGAQIAAGESWPSVVRKGFNHIATYPNGSRARDAKDGLFGFWKPSDPDDFKFLPVGVDTPSNYINSYPLTPQSDVLCIMADIPVNTGRAGTWTLAATAETRTSNPWFGTTTSSPLDRASSAMAIELIRGMPQWHENPMHLSDVVQWIRTHKKAMGAGLAGLTAIFPAAAPFAAAGAAALAAI